MSTSPEFELQPRRLLADALFAQECESFVLPDYFPNTIQVGVQILGKQPSTEFGGRPCFDLDILGVIDAEFSDLVPVQQLLTVTSLWTHNRSLFNTTDHISSQIYEDALRNGVSHKEATVEALFAPHKAFELLFAHRSVTLMQNLLDQPLDHSVEHVLRGLVKNYRPSISIHEYCELLLPDVKLTPDLKNIDQVTLETITSGLARILEQWMTSEEAVLIARAATQPHEQDDGNYGCQSQAGDETARILMPTLPGCQGPDTSIGRYVHQRSIIGDTEWLTFLGLQDDATLSRIAKTYARIQTGDGTMHEDIDENYDHRKPHGLLALFNTPEFGKEFAYYIFDIAEKVDSKTLVELSDLVANIVSNQAWGFFQHIAQAYARTKKELLGSFNHLDVSAEDQQYAEYLTGIMSAVQKRTIEILAAMHDVTTNQSCTTNVYRNSGREEVNLTDPKVFICALRLLDSMLEVNSGAMCSGFEQIHLSNTDDTSHFSYTNFETNERCRITIRPHENPNAEARILWTISPAIEDLDEETIAVALELAGLDTTDNTRLLANNKKGRRLREISMRLDLEKREGELSFDIGGTTHPEESPLNNLLATAIAAGASRLSHHHNEPMILDNHVRETFTDDQANYERFGTFLATTAFVLSYTQGRSMSKEKSEEARQRQLEFIETFRSTITMPIDVKLNLL